MIDGIISIMDSCSQLLLCLAIIHAVLTDCSRTPGTREGVSFKLNDGNEMPAVALGTSLGHSEDGRRMLSVNKFVANSIQRALTAGYRHIDTAAISGVENEVGLGLNNFINSSGLTREYFYVTTKLWNDAHDEDQVVPALKKSLAELQMDYVDLYLVHYPMAYKSDGNISLTDYLTTWKGMEQAKAMNLTRSIGVSNFNLTQMQRLWENARVKPAVLQIRVNPTMTQDSLVDWCQEHGVVVMSHSPFGSILGHNKAAPLPRADDLYMQLLTVKYNKNVPQILIRYLLERNISVVVPIRMQNNRLERNIDVFGFNLTQEELTNFSAFNRNYTSKKKSKWFDHPHYPF